MCRSYQVDTVYSEGHTYKLLWAARDQLDIPVDELMEVIGRDFYQFTFRYDYNKVRLMDFDGRNLLLQILRVIGRSLPEFLNGLDELHEYLRFSFRRCIHCDLAKTPFLTLV